MPSREAPKADVEFMQGMIMHHQQAVDMVALLRTRVKSPALDLSARRSPSRKPMRSAS